MTARGMSEIRRRMSGFTAHLRLNGYSVGPADAALALEALRPNRDRNPALDRASFKTVFCTSPEEWRRFDDHFEAYWLARGTVRRRVRRSDPAGGQTANRRLPQLWNLAQARDGTAAPGRADFSESPSGDEDGDPTPLRLTASNRPSLAHRDLRHITDAAEMQEARDVAMRLARAIRFRLSRRLVPSSGSRRLDMRRTVRKALSRAGEPIDLRRVRRREEDMRIVLFLDVSGSMNAYVRVYLQFAAGLVSGWDRTEAYLIHTRLVRVTDALREKDAVKAATRLGLMARGLGGGTRLGESLAVFNSRHARRALNSRTAVIIISDGYDTGAPERLAQEVARLRRRAGKIIWLNPLLGWRDYKPATAAIQEALPHLDRFLPAHSLQALARLEDELARL